MTHTTMSLMKFIQELQNFIWMQDAKCSCRDELRKGWFAWNGEMMIDLAKYPCRHPILRVIIDLEKNTLCTRCSGVPSIVVPCILWLDALQGTR